MAEKRMFNKKIIDSDAFLDMPLSAQALYFHISMRADDEGFVDKPKSILRTVRANEDDFKILLAKRFIIPFDSGVCVVKHWWINNYIQNDRFTPTVYKDERAMLEIKDNKSYTECIQPGYKLDTQISIDKISIGKSSIDKKEYSGVETPNVSNQKFIKPTLEEVETYAKEKDYTLDCEHFISFYESNGWKVGKNPMKNWRSAITNWVKRQNEYKPKYQTEKERIEQEASKIKLGKGFRGLEI